MKQEQKIHHGKNVKKLGELLGIHKQELLVKQHITIQEYCKNENCKLIDMGYEYILIHKDKYVIARTKKDGGIDIKPNSKSYKLLVIILPVFIIYFLYMILETMHAHYYFLLSIYALYAVLFLSVCIYCFFYSTAETVIKKEKVIKIYKGKILNVIFIKYKNKNNKIKIRGVTCPVDKNKRELAFQLLNEYVEDEK